MKYHGCRLREVFMRYYRKITGERLYLSPVNTGDSEIYVKWMNDAAVAVNFSQYQFTVAGKDDLKWLFEPGDSVQRYAIVLTDGDVMIGTVSLQNIDHLNRNAFVGIFIGEAEHRGRGYGAEAIRLILHYGFNTLNLHNIMLSVSADNPGAIACCKKVGFNEAGRRREWILKEGRYIDRLYMDILEREFNGW
jgi:RimJ/RimL family protein N-acetyltransferase